MKMQALGSISSWPRLNKVSEPCERNGFNPVTIAPNDRRGHGQRIHDGFLRRFDGGRDDRIHVRIREVRQRIGRLFGVVWNDVRRRESENEVSAAMAGC
jgi:hypothetical protein